MQRRLETGPSLARERPVQRVDPMPTLQVQGFVAPLQIGQIAADKLLADRPVEPVTDTGFRLVPGNTLQGSALELTRLPDYPHAIALNQGPRSSGDRAAAS